MDFEHTDDRRMLADSLGRFLREKYPIERRHAAAASPEGFDREIWQGLAEMGVIGALIGEEAGGFGGKGFDLAVVFEQVGRALVASLAARGQPVIAVGRDRSKLAGLGGADTRVADFGDKAALAATLCDAEQVVSCAHARFVAPLLAALPAHVSRLVLMGSTRKFTRFADEKALMVQAGEQAYLASGRPGVMVHPTMIYGVGAENNIERVAAIIRRFGVVPLPQGGRSLIQPIHLDDVVRVLEAALRETGGGVGSVVLAGPRAVPYAELIRAVGRAIGRPVRILPVPTPLLLGMSWVTGFVPGVPTIAAGEVRRLLEDKDFDVSEMVKRFGFEPVSLEAGLARSFVGG
jgi:uncharacterized protein YbjT (DUF2867 family)